MMDKTIELIAKHLVPTWDKIIRQYERDKTCDRDAIRVMKVCITQIDEFAVGILDTVNWDTIRFLDEAVIPLATQSIYLENSYYDPKNPTQWDPCIDDLRTLSTEMKKTKKRVSTRGYTRHFNMFGIVISKERN